jgi:hypothetical protein
MAAEANKKIEQLTLQIIFAIPIENVRQMGFRRQGLSMFAKQEMCFHLDTVEPPLRAAVAPMVKSGQATKYGQPQGWAGWPLPAEISYR